MKEISYKEIRNLPFGTRVNYVSSDSGHIRECVKVDNGLVYKDGSMFELDQLEAHENYCIERQGYSIYTYYVVEDENAYEKMWKQLKKKVVNDRDYYGSSRSVYSCSDYDERKHRMSTLNDIIAIMSSIEKSHE